MTNFHISVAVNDNESVQDQVDLFGIEIDEQNGLPSYEEVMKHPEKYPLSNPVKEWIEIDYYHEKVVLQVLL